MGIVEIEVEESSSLGCFNIFQDNPDGPDIIHVCFDQVDKLIKDLITITNWDDKASECDGDGYHAPQKCVLAQLGWGEN